MEDNPRLVGRRFVAGLRRFRFADPNRRGVRGVIFRRPILRIAPFPVDTLMICVVFMSRSQAGKIIRSFGAPQPINLPNRYLFLLVDHPTLRVDALRA